MQMQMFSIVGTVGEDTRGRGRKGATRYKRRRQSIFISSSDLPLPYGRVQEFVPRTNHPFWVSNTSTPPPCYIHD